jgi:polyferredoxin
MDMRKKEKPVLQKIIFPAIMLITFWILAIVLWQSTQHIFYLFNFGYIGSSLGFGIGLYSLLPRKRKPLGRKVAQFLVGGYMLGFLGLFAFENMQIEGFFFYLLSGFFAGAVMHYLIAKVLGPVLFNRGWCGLACWTAMVLDLLPFTRNSGWVSGKLRWLRFGFFAFSLGLVLVLWFGFGFRYQSKATELYWLLVGNAVYYGLAIPTAFFFKDNRAFCKYICPITAILKTTSRFSLLKISGEAETCDDCGACTKMCPMSIRIPEYIKNGERVLSTECILCQTCVSVCPSQTLRISFGWDMGGKELLVERKK